MSADELMRRWIRPEIRALQAYHVPPAAGLIKLDAMENPYTWPEAMVGDWLELLRTTTLNRYPDPEGQALKARLRESLGLAASPHELLLGNGSDELIQLLALAVAAPGRVVLAPEPSFVMYRMIAGFVGMDFVGVPLCPDFTLDLAAMQAAIARHQPALIFLACPNNPTGNLFPLDEVRALIEASPGLVVVDEAYYAFASRHYLGLLDEYPNVVVMRTLSKVGLAGLRLGLLVGAPVWLEQFNKLRLPYNINTLTQVSAEFALRHAAVLTEQTARIRVDRAELYAQLQALPGISAYPSEANFVLFRVPAGRAGGIFAALNDAGVLIKNLSAAGPLLADCLRVTVGRPEENAAFLRALKAAL